MKLSILILFNEMNRKVVKFTPQLSELVKKGEKYTTFRIFDDKDLSEGDEIVLATRDGDTVTEFGEAIITKVNIKTVSTLSKDDFIGHEKIEGDILQHYKGYYGNTIDNNTEVKVIRFKTECFY